jgi:hypothetical protein
MARLLGEIEWSSPPRFVWLFVAAVIRKRSHVLSARLFDANHCFYVVASSDVPAILESLPTSHLFTPD